MAGAMTRRLLFTGNEAAYFMAHRHDLARAARDAGWEVHVASPPGAAIEEMRAAGFVPHVLPVTRSGMRPDRELLSLVAHCRLIRRLQPDLIHAIALKAIVLTGFANRLSGNRPLILGVMGLGHFFTEPSLEARLIRLLFRLLFPLLVGRRCRVVHQNQADLERLSYTPAVAARSALVRGSGVDVEQFRPAPEPPGPVTVLLPARMIWKKGIGQFVEAARLLAAADLGVRMVLAGDSDAGNPFAVPREQLVAWNQSGVVTWLGHQTDMPALFASCHIVALPTYYGEGLPQSLLEAAASGRPIVTTDTPGCNDVVHHEDNGLLVPPRDPAALAAALQRLCRDPALRRRLGARGRTRAMTEFSMATVHGQMLEMYDSLAR